MTAGEVKRFSRQQARAGLGHDERVDRMRTTVIACETREAFAYEISQLWDTAQQSFLAIGRYLVAAKAKLEAHGQWQELIDNDLPFGRHTAHKFLGIAAAVDGGLLPAERLPNDYNTAYALARLNPPEIAIAEERRLIRPDVRREDVMDFKREMAISGPTPRVVQTQKRAALIRRCKTLQEKIDSMQAELLRLEAQISQLG